MTPRSALLYAARTLLVLAIGGAGGALAYLAHLPMPWMLGSLAASAVAIAIFQDNVLAEYDFPQPIRAGFVALIGVMIGTQVSPELFRELANLPLMLAALALFVVLAHGGNTLIFRRMGGFDRPTAIYSGTPGGLMESIALGEAAGADVRLLTMQQFLRIILVISLIPMGVSIWAGEPVGSAAGVVPGADQGPVGIADLMVIVAAALTGLWIATFIHLPASQIVGPLLLSAGLTLTGQVDLHLPFWLIALAQAVIGVGLGMRFRGVTARLIGRSIGLSLVSVTYMLTLGGLLALALWQLTDMNLLQLLLSFAPGGVTEMSLIALGLAANPALVSLHHVLRILMTVGEVIAIAKILERREKRDAAP